MAVDNRQDDNIASAITQVSENLSNLVHDEIELAKAEVKKKSLSVLRGVGAVAAGAVFGIFAVGMSLVTIAWALDAVLVNGVGDIWIGFAIVTVALMLLSAIAFIVAWKHAPGRATDADDGDRRGQEDPRHGFGLGGRRV